MKPQNGLLEYLLNSKIWPNLVTLKSQSEKNVAPLGISRRLGGYRLIANVVIVPFLKAGN